MQAALVLTAQEGSTAHDKPVSPTVGDQELFERPSRHGPRWRTPVASICEGSPGLTSVERRRHARDVSQRQAVLRALQDDVPASTTAGSKRRHRRGSIPIAATRGPRFRAIEFLRRLLMAIAGSHAHSMASQKPLYCATLNKLRSSSIPLRFLLLLRHGVDGDGRLRLSSPSPRREF